MENMRNNENNKKIESKNFWKFFVLLFIINVVILNWSDISWIFSYRAAPRGIQAIMTNQLPSVVNKEKEYFEKKDSIEIPAIQITAPIIFPSGSTDLDFERYLKKGVNHFPGSAMPGEKGVLILLGHSAPPGWPKIDYDWIFTDIEQLEKGDKINIYFNKELFVYTVTEKVILEVGEDVPTYSSSQPEIILLSCWPPGKNIKRIGVRGLLTN